MLDSFKRITRVLLAILLIICLCVCTGWGVLAIYFGDSQTSLLQTALAAGFGMTGFITLIGIWYARTRSKVLIFFLLLFVIVLVWWFNIEPSNDRHWQTPTAKLPYATIEGDLVTMHNVRNFTYRSETDFTPAYYTRTYDLNKLDSVDLFAVYWMGPAIAHTIISFGFGGEDYLAISIEARNEQGEGYSTIKGFFRQFELFYVVADERDMIRLRTNYRNDPPEHVYRYRLQSTPENARRFFLDYVATINELNEKPRFYNTLTANCTNVIWVHAHVNPGRIPFSWKILASGYAPEYLYSQGRLDTTIPFDQLTENGYVNRISISLNDSPDFAKQIRLRPGPGKTE
jgi:hypothetical protein